MRISEKSWIAVLWLGTTSVVNGQKVAFGTCDDPLLNGPSAYGAVMWTPNDNMTVVAVKECELGKPCDLFKIKCAGIVDQGDKHYYNSIVSATRHLDTNKRPTQPLAQCHRDCGFEELLPGEKSKNPIVSCMESETCRGVTVFPNTLDETHQCSKSNCWDMMDASHASLPVNTDIGTDFWELSKTFYYKVRVNIDYGGSIPASDRTCKPFVWGQSGFSLPELFRGCDEDDACQAVSVQETPQIGLMACTFKKPIVSFAPKKLSEFTVKMFLKRGSKHPEFFGYLAFPANSMPKSQVLQTFESSSNYYAPDCVSMCDALDSCTGYMIRDGVCRELLQNSDSTNIVQATGSFFRKRTSSTDELSECEKLEGGCDDSATKVSVIVGASLGGVAALIFALVVLGRYFKRTAVAELSDEDEDRENDRAGKALSLTHPVTSQ